MNKERGDIVNKVAQSGIITLDMEQIIPDMPLISLDIKEQLFQGLILREKEFRTWIDEHDWTQYEGQRVAVFCSTDAIVPTWAYMLIAKSLSPYTDEVYYAPVSELATLIAERHTALIKPEDYIDKRVVIKGCGDREISNHAFVSLSTRLTPVVKTLMFGEPCSTVPVYKRK